MNKTIYCWWTGETPMSSQRKACLDEMKKMEGCTIVFITKDTLPTYILPEHPLHPGYQYLSETQKGDYLKAYFMNFYGGGYSDIKRPGGSWVSHFDTFYKSDAWVCGYPERMADDVAYKPVRNYYKELVGNGSYICKKQTPITQEWYTSMIELLDSKLENLKKNPAKHAQDKAEDKKGYPIEWNEMNGRIFHRVCYKYKERLMKTLPRCDCTKYR